MVERFRYFEHTADLGIEVQGETLELLMENAAYGLVETLVDPAGIDRARSRDARIDIDGGDLEDLLVDWLSEHLYLFDREGWISREIHVREVGKVRENGHFLTATLGGEGYEAGRHDLRHAVKAVTYHGLEVRYDEGLWQARIIFDV